jgi:hypothetical protein
MATGDIKTLQENSGSTFDEVLLSRLYTIQVGSLTLLDTGWTLDSGLYYYELEDSNITANDIVEVIPDNADIALVVAAEILPATVSAAGKVTIYAINEPTDDIGVTINITRKA